MNVDKICPNCGKPLPGNASRGLCPDCLIKVGLGTGVEIGPDTDDAAAARRSGFVPPAPEDLAPLFPQLDIVSLVGHGGMGAVYKARQTQLNRFVALKILPPGLKEEPAFADRFVREAQALAQLHHPHIVTLFEFGQTEGQFYFLMEFLDGVNLRQLMANSRISAREALAIVPQICDALQYAHDRGIVHRDIKPENILLNQQGQVKIADFGVARLMAMGAEESGHPLQSAGSITETGKIVGTPQYMAPEQFTAPGEVDHRADIYALGVVFYQMLTGQMPAGKVEAPSRKVQVDVRLDEVVLRALEKDPTLRYQNVTDLKTQIETIEADRQYSKRDNHDRAPGNTQSFPRAVLAAAGAICVILVLTVIALSKLEATAGTDSVDSTIISSGRQSAQSAEATGRSPTASELLGAARKATASTTITTVQLGPITERILPPQDGRGWNMLDLDTAACTAPPLEIQAALNVPNNVFRDRLWQSLDTGEHFRPAKYMAWLQEGGVDLLYQHSGKLVGFNGTFGYAKTLSSTIDEIEADQVLRGAMWASYGASDITQRIPLHVGRAGSYVPVSESTPLRADRQKPADPHVFIMDLKDSRLWFFNTRKGASGVMQIDDVADGTGSIKVRYRLLDKSDPKSSASQLLFVQPLQSGPDKRLLTAEQYGKLKESNPIPVPTTLEFRWVGTADEGDKVEQVPWLDSDAASKAGVPPQLWLRKEALFDQSAISNAFFEFPSGEDLYPMLKLQFNPEAATRLAELTEKSWGRRLAIVIGGKIVAGVIIKTRLGNGQFVVSGMFTDGEIAAITGSVLTKRSERDGFLLDGEAKLHPSQETGKLNDVTTITVSLAPNIEFHWVASNARSEKAFEVAWREQSRTSDSSNLLIAGEVLFDLTAITSISVEERGDRNDDATVRLRLSEGAAHRLADLTKKNIGRRLAILVDGKVLMAPTIQGAITDGLVAITGKFTLEELSNLLASVGPGAAIKKEGTQ